MEENEKKPGDSEPQNKAGQPRKKESPPIASTWDMSFSFSSSSYPFPGHAPEVPPASKPGAGRRDEIPDEPAQAAGEIAEGELEEITPEPVDEADYEQPPAYPRPRPVARTSAPMIIPASAPPATRANPTSVMDPGDPNSPQGQGANPQNPNKMVFVSSLKTLESMEIKSMIGGFLLGVFLVGGMAFWIMPSRHEITRLKSNASVILEDLKRMQNELENARAEATNLRLGNKHLTGLLNALHDDWDKPPERPRYLRVPKGVIIYWGDNFVWRRYYLYQGRDNGGISRVNMRPTRQSFIYIAEPPKSGSWYYAVTALNKVGKETTPSDKLLLRYPLP